MASHSGAHTPRAPCTPAVPPIDASATVPPPRHLAPPRPALSRRAFWRCSRLPAASPRARPPALLPLLPAPQDAPPAAPRFLPTRSGILGSLLENRSVPETRWFHPATTDQDRRSYTFALRPP